MPQAAATDKVPYLYYTSLCTSDIVPCKTFIVHSLLSLLYCKQPNTLRRKTMDFVTLSNGVKMPVLGFGVFQIDAKETEQCVLDCNTGWIPFN